MQRAVTEARAGRFTPDVIDTNGPEIEALSREKLLAEFYSPSFVDIPAVAFPAHRQYVAERFDFFTIAWMPPGTHSDEASLVPIACSNPAE